MKRKHVLMTFILLLSSLGLRAQDFVLKTDLSGWATASMNIEPEVRLTDKTSLALGLSYNPWTFSDNMKWRHLRVQPEYRYWFCRALGGHFLGLHASYTRFNIGNVDLPGDWLEGLEDNRYQGNEWAVGLGYGYHWILGKRFSMEFEAGVGYSYSDYAYYECKTCGDRLGEETKHKFMPTKISVSLVYVIK